MDNPVVKYIIGALIVLLLAGILTPIGLSFIHNANTSGWSSTEVTIFSTLSVLVLVGILIGVITLAMRKGK